MTMTRRHITKSQVMRDALQRAERDLPKEKQTFSQWLALMEWMISEMRANRKKCKDLTPEQARGPLAEIMAHAAWLSVGASRMLSDIIDNLNAGQ